MARIRLREQIEGPSDEALVERALTEWVERPKMTPAEERVVATHESGHAVCSMFCKHATPIERISIQSDIAGALGYVRHQEHVHRYVVTRGRLLDDLCVLMGGREAELLLLDDLSIGCAGDLERATEIARALVEEFGMGGEDVGIGRFPTRSREEGERRQYSPEQLAAVDRSVRRILEEARQRAAALLKEHQSLVETLRDLLLEHKVIDAKTLATIA
jgi:cell division protease FtsH